jgi:CheY-like chemotaxis protein
VVDDEPDITLTLKTVLENNGYVVDVFNDPIMSLENFKKIAADDIASEVRGGGATCYGLVLTDIRMPNMNGFDYNKK